MWRPKNRFLAGNVPFPAGGGGGSAQVEQTTPARGSDSESESASDGVAAQVLLGHLRSLGVACAGVVVGCCLGIGSERRKWKKQQAVAGDRGSSEERASLVSGLQAQNEE